MNPSILLDHSPTSDPNRPLLRALLRIEGTVPEGDNRIPLNLSVVLDRSGSMSGVFNLRCTKVITHSGPARCVEASRRTKRARD